MSDQFDNGLRVDQGLPPGTQTRIQRGLARHAIAHELPPLDRYVTINGELFSVTKVHHEAMVRQGVATLTVDVSDPDPAACDQALARWKELAAVCIADAVDDLVPTAMSSDQVLRVAGSAAEALAEWLWRDWS